ncbi:transposon Tf2-1 polyprotein isoform X1 [Cucumis melo var. makuwa]|uniref:Transposon Tf2-1 polyprotein isoform X1 n=1 Tax=Cucumis melo var. makuwa TaxID=1194695 RepID=A0A5D3BNJ2_CUCMM|nr:transposon Tf2-1 polyprotein isoform X1 [Cucumis melo var. makuwa]
MWKMRRLHVEVGIKKVRGGSRRVCSFGNGERLGWFPPRGSLSSGFVINKQYQQQQVILKYIEGIIRDDLLGKQVVEGSSSKTKSDEPIITTVSTELKEEEKADEGCSIDRSKFKKVEMLVFNGTDLDSWLFRADRYFKIHNFDGPVLDWYRS